MTDPQRSRLNPDEPLFVLLLQIRSMMDDQQINVLARFFCQSNHLTEEHCS